MQPLNREAFLAIPAPEVTPVDLPALGGRVYVRELTAGERDRFETDHAQSSNSDFRAKLMAACVCDESGKRLFSDADARKLSDLPASHVERLVREIIRVNALSDQDVEDLEKN